MKRMRSHLSRVLCSAIALAGCAAIAASSSAQPVSAAQVSASAASAAPATPGQLTLITEPQNGIAPILSAITGAKHQVDMVMYEDSDSQVNAALVADVKRKVAVRVLLNGGYYSQGNFPQDAAAYSYLKAHGVPVRWTPKYFALTHQKTLIVRRARLHPHVQPHTPVLCVQP